jgi:murein L,D-transpeptidase YafK
MLLLILSYLLTFGPPSSPYKVVIDKSEYEMTIYDTEGWVATYPVVFGSKNQGDKKMEGDRLTPDGTFKIVSKKYHKDWGCFMLLDYPTKDNLQRFQDRKTNGQIPKTAKIGNGIGIHGTKPSEEYAIDKFLNWTNGCISTKYSDIFEIYELLPVGTTVIIQQ